MPLATSCWTRSSRSPSAASSMPSSLGSSTGSCVKGDDATVAEANARSAGVVNVRPPNHDAGMDFNDTPQEVAWRDEFRAWLDENAPKVAGAAPERDMEIGGGDYLDRAKRWQAMKFDAGLARITWEPEYGGRNGSTMESIIYGQEEGRYP